MAIVSKVWAIRPHRPLVTPVFFNATQRLSSCFDLDFSLNIDFSRCIYITSLPLNVNVFFFKRDRTLFTIVRVFFNNMKTAQIRWHFSLRYLKFVVRWYSVNRILLSKIRSYLLYRMNSSIAIILFSCVALTITSIQHVSRKSTQALWTSCNRFDGFPSILTCYSFCINVFDDLYLFSRDFITGTCYCCDKVPGLDDQYLSNSDKRSFKTGRCIIIYFWFLNFKNICKTF